MATVRSLGLLQTPALPFLISESLLPQEPSDNDYVWKSVGPSSDGSSDDDDIVYTKTCVVWCRGGVVRRVYRLDVEKEEIRDVVLTLFPSRDVRKPSRNGSVPNERFSDHESESKTRKNEEQSSDDMPRLVPTADGRGLLSGSSSLGQSSKALVVVLKTQAHIYFLEGNSHVVPLPFEVDSVFASPRGVVFQRKLHDTNSSSLQRAPPPQQLSGDFDPSRSFRSPKGRDGRLSDITFALESIRRPQGSAYDPDMPRLFCLTDPQSEMGLVVANQTPRSSHAAAELRGYDTLDPADEIVYVSDANELAGLDFGIGDTPMAFVVTCNTKTGLYTLWTARYRADDDGPMVKKPKKSLHSGARSARRSSHLGVPTGTTTPALRSSTMRESFGASRNASGPSFSQTFPAEETPDQADLETQIGQELGDIGTKSSRRVSSLMARAELGSSQDRTAFSDLATGNPANTASHGSFRQSVGGYSTRASFGFNPRLSFAGTASVHSTSSSFPDAPVDRLLDELNNSGEFEGFESMDLSGSASGLPKEMLLRKVESFASTGNVSFSDPRRMPIKPKIFILQPDQSEDLRNPDSSGVAVCLVDRNSRSLVVVNLKIERLPLASRSSGGNASKKQSKSEKHAVVVHAINVRHVANVTDACKIVDGNISRILVLTSTMDGRGELSLHSPWSASVKVELPNSLLLRDPYRPPLPLVAPRSEDAGMNRVIADSSQNLVGVDHASSRGKVSVIDAFGRRHHIQIQLQPSNPLVRKALGVCRYVLKDSPRAAAGLLIGWWEVLRWLRSRNVQEHDLEWTALVVLLFTMAVGFVDAPQTPAGPVKQRRKKVLLRSSSGSYIDQESWESMLESMAGSSGLTAPWMMDASWSWMADQTGDSENGPSTTSSPAKSPPIEQQPFVAQKFVPKNVYLTRCAGYARDFFDSPQGEAASGSDGYLPTALCQDATTRRTALCTMLVGLHLLREERKLSVYDAESSYRESGMLAPVLAQLGGWLGWPSWTWKEDGYYGMEMASLSMWQFEESRVSALDVPPEPFAPPSIFDFLNDWLAQPSATLFTLLDTVSAGDRTPGKSKLWNEAFKLTPRTLALCGFLSETGQKRRTVDKVKLLLRWGLTSNIIESFPEGVSAQLHELILRCQIRPPSSWTSDLVELIDRDDLYLSMGTDCPQPAAVSRASPATGHDAVRDVHHIGQSTLDIDPSNSFEASIEADRIALTKLIFREDRRFVEASKLLNQSKPPVAQCIPDPEWSDSELLEAQKEVVQLVTLRTLSVPAGRAMFFFSGRAPLLTEKLPIPSFSLQCVVKPSNVTMSADRSAFSEEKVCWAFFHNGAATGLAISRHSRGIDTSWILFNKPPELTNRHAGFLLALGLNGHLKNLAKWVAFKYLTPKHTMTSIGLLLGLSASYLGTMDTLITRLLSVHVTRLLPPGSAELNLSPLTQTAGVMGIGLLYCNSQHRRMSEVLLSEIEHVEQEDITLSQEDLRDEGYRLAAGFALGFINLSKGKDMRGLRDMQIVERLLALAAGTKNVDLVHILDRATAGATMALAIIFMKTNDATVASKVDIPDTAAQFDYVRPDLFLLRTLARHLIMWDGIEPTHEWLQRNLPREYRKRYRLTGVRRLDSDDMPFFNIVAGLCFAIGLRYAGSASVEARDLLLWYLDQFIRISRLPALNYDSKLTRNSVRHCQDSVALSAAAVMAGTGDLELFRRLRSLHGRVDADTSYGSHMAAHMAIGMLFLGGGSYTLGTSDLAVAALLCAFYPIFPTTVLDNKCHLQAFRHLWVLAAEPRCLVPRDADTRRPISVPVTLTLKDGTTQTATAPCLLPDLDQIAVLQTHSKDHWPVTLDLSRNRRLRDKFRRGDQSIYLRRNNTTAQSLISSSASASASGGRSAFATTLLGLSEAQDVLPTASGKNPPNAVALFLAQQQQQHPTGRRRPNPTHDIWDWIFQLPSLRALDVTDRSLVLPPAPIQFRARYHSPATSAVGAITIPPWLRLSPVDARLVLEGTVQNALYGTEPDAVRDQLWQLRLLFEWVDHRVEEERTNDHSRDHDKEEEEGVKPGQCLWLKREVIEEARWKIWAVRVGGEV